MPTSAEPAVSAPRQQPGWLSGASSNAGQAMTGQPEWQSPVSVAVRVTPPPAWRVPGRAYPSRLARYRPNERLADLYGDDQSDAGRSAAARAFFTP